MVFDFPSCSCITHWSPPMTARRQEEEGDNEPQHAGAKRPRKREKADSPAAAVSSVLERRMISSKINQSAIASLFQASAEVSVLQLLVRFECISLTHTLTESCQAQPFVGFCHGQDSRRGLLIVYISVRSNIIIDTGLNIYMILDYQPGIGMR